MSRLDMVSTQPLQITEINKDWIPEMAEIALTVTRPVENNPRQPSLKDVIALYEMAFNGTTPF